MYKNKLFIIYKTYNICWVFKKFSFKENQGKIKECFENHGSFVIKEIFKKEGILKPGNFFKNI